MTEPMGAGAGGRPMASTGGYTSGQRPEPANLADILERVLDKGIVIAGDIQVNLLDIELLTIKLRLVVASVDRAREMGIDWWEHDSSLSSAASGTDAQSQVSGAASRPGVSASNEAADLSEENRRLRERIQALEAQQQSAAPATSEHVGGDQRG